MLQLLPLWVFLVNFLGFVYADNHVLTKQRQFISYLSKFFFLPIPSTLLNKNKRIRNTWPVPDCTRKPFRYSSLGLLLTVGVCETLFIKIKKFLLWEFLSWRCINFRQVSYLHQLVWSYDFFFSLLIQWVILTDFWTMNLLCILSNLPLSLVIVFIYFYVVLSFTR